MIDHHLILFPFLFARKMNKHQQSIPFLLDLEKVFAEDRWTVLLADTRKNILDCFIVLNDCKKVVQYALLLASSQNLEMSERSKYLIIAKDNIPSLTKDDPLIISMEEMFPIGSITMKSQGVFVTNAKLELILNLESNLMEKISFASICVYLSYEPFSPQARARSQDKQVAAKNSLLCPHPFSTINRKNFRVRPKFETYHNTFNSEIEIGIRCCNLNQIFKRSVEPSNGPSTMEPCKSTMNHSFVSSNIDIAPGSNELILTFEPIDSGCYSVEGIKLTWKDELISFTHQPLTAHLCFTVISEEPSLKLIDKDGNDNVSNLEIISGPPQHITLRLNSGSYSFQPGATITLKSSTDLFMRLIQDESKQEEESAKHTNYSPLEVMDNNDTNNLANFSNSIDINFKSSLDPFQNHDIPLIIVSKFAHQRGPSGTEHNITLSYPDNKTEAIKSISRILHLTPPFMSTAKLHILVERKFLEINIRAVSKQRFELFDANLVANEIEKERNDEFLFKSFNSPRRMILYKDQTVHYLWEIFSKESNTLSKLLFSLKYNTINEQFSTNPLAYHSYDCDFTIKSIKPTVE